MRTAIACVIFALCCGATEAQSIYKYRDADGVWVYTDRRPVTESEFEERQLETRGEKAEVQLLRRETPDGLELVVRNTYYAPVQISFRLLHMENLSADSPVSGLKLLPPRANASLMSLRRADLTAPMSIEYELHYLPGPPDAEHRPDAPYRLPYALATGYPVSQAFPDQITHNDPASQHAFDFVMPVGTAVFAARGGVVIEVASDSYEGGLDAATDGPRANIVRVLHDDGTMSLYAHLNWNSIRVVPGQRVARGEYLADSGNTGFSSGPHLHFVVQRNRDGNLVSEPVEFTGPGGSAVTVRRGEEPVAH